MKRIGFIIASVGLLLAACTNNSYTITGTVADPSLEGTRVVKVKRSTDMNIAPQQDSTLVKDGKYSFTGKTDYPDNVYIYIGKDENGFPVAYTSVVVEPGARITVDMNEKRLFHIAGTELNDITQKNADDYQALVARLEAADSRLNSDASLTDEERAALKEEIETCSSQLRTIDYDFVKNNINNPGAWAKLYNVAVMAGSLDRQKELIAGAEGRTKELADYKEIVERIEKLEKTDIGQPFTDFEMEDPEGNLVKLSDWAGKGKYILVDFWASWCAPCKAEMPNVVKCYHKYKDRGFDIVSVSLDTKKDNWTKAIGAWGMPWHHMSDLKGWKGETVNTYAVTAVPHVMLLGPDGKIVARGLYGKSLYEKLAEVMPD